MPDAIPPAVLLTLALATSVAGMGWLALSMQVHAQQAWRRAPSLARLKALRRLGAIALAIALGLCLGADHASMAVLVWFMALASAALTVAFTLSWRPHWLRVLAPWIKAQP